MNSLFTQNVIAVIWDFDKTLIPGYMQDPIFERFNIDGPTFWKETNGLKEYYKAQGIEVSADSVYLNHLLTYAKEGKFKGTLSNALLRQLGEMLTFYPGIPDFLKDLRQMIIQDPVYQKHDIKLEHYIVSTGLRQMILGSGVAKFVEDVWGCEFIESPAPSGYLASSSSNRATHEISQLGYVIDNTTKTRAVFEINKGSNKFEINVNDTIATEDRRVPFQNMVYVADGPSDVPVFSVINQYGGQTFAVYNPKVEAQFKQVDDLQRQGRIGSYGPANYEAGSQAYLWLSNSVRRIADEIVNNRQRLLAARIGKSPVHIAEKPDQLPLFATSAKSDEPTTPGINGVAYLSFDEFAAMFQSGEKALSVLDLKDLHRALVKFGEQRKLSLEEVRSKARNFAADLSRPLDRDMFLGETADRASAHRLPKNPDDWEKI